MTLNELQKDEIVVIEANILIYALGGKSNQCERLIRRCADGEIHGVLSSTVLSEVMHRLMLAEARENGWISGPNPTKQLSGKPESIKTLWRYEDAIKNLLATGIHLEPIGKEDFITAMRIEREHGLLTNDALLLAVAERLRIQAIATADKRLIRVRGIIAYSPDDLRDPVLS